jgi:hypothetical protein
MEVTSWLEISGKKMDLLTFIKMGSSDRVKYGVNDNVINMGLLCRVVSKVKLDSASLFQKYVFGYEYC